MLIHRQDLGDCIFGAKSVQLHRRKSLRPSADNEELTVALTEQRFAI